MNKKSRVKLLAGAILGVGAIFLSSCTANFCSTTDSATIAYPYEQGVTVYLSKTDYDSLKNSDDEQVKNVIKQEETWSDEAEKYGLPRIAGPAISGNDVVYKYIPFTYKTTTTTNDDGSTTTTIDRTTDGDLIVSTYTAKKAQSTFISTFNSAVSNNYYLPSLYYWGLVDDYNLKASLVEYSVEGVATNFGNYVDTKTWDTFAASTAGKELIAKLTACDATGDNVAINPYTVCDTDGSNTNLAPSETGKTAEQIDVEKSVLRQTGYLRFSGEMTDSSNSRPMWGYWTMWNNEIATKVGKGFSQLDAYSIPSSDYVSLYKSNVESTVSSIRSCIATRSGYYGHYGSNADWRVGIQQKDWGYAWKKGFLEGLLVYPVSWLTDTFAFGMDPALTGVGQIWAIVFVTLIIRGLLLLVSWRTTLDQQRMQELQPELAKIQAKYPNANTNQAEKQRLSQEQMALYKRHNVKPFRQLLVLIIQFPVFICVWSGLQGSSALATGEFLNLALSDTIQTTLFNVSGQWWTNVHGWWTALVLFLLMAGVQIMAMLLPRIFQKIQAKKMPKMGVNNAQNQQNKTMKWVSIAMMVFTIVMGFMLPAAMGVYWLIGGLISMAQTAITQLIIAKGKKKRK